MKVSTYETSKSIRYFHSMYNLSELEMLVWRINRYTRDRVTNLIPLDSFGCNKYGSPRSSLQTLQFLTVACST